jgi:hypothetical protein
MSRQAIAQNLLVRLEKWRCLEDESHLAQGPRISKESRESKLVLQLTYSKKLTYVRGVLRSERFFDMGFAAGKVQFLSRKTGMNSMAILHESLESSRTNH